MKFRLSKPVVAAAPSKKPIVTFSTAFYDDPAFSPDPRSHPYFATEYNWESPPAPGHPTLRGQRRRRSPGIHDATAETEVDSFQLLQPPNSPTSPDGVDEPQSTSYPPPSSTSNSIVLSSIPTAPTHTSILSRAFVNSKDPTRKRGSLLSWLKEAQLNMGSLSNVTKPSQSHPDVPPPPYEANPAKVTKPAMLTALTSDRQSARSRLATIPSLQGGTNQGGPAHNWRLQDLDRIDELDHSNPLGIALHHGGPYEAVRSAVQSGVQMPLGFSNNDRGLQTVGDVYTPPQAPAGVPLNLSPGQILPRNFRRQQAKPPRLRSGEAFLSSPGQLEASRSVPQESVIPPRHRAQLSATGHATPRYRNHPPRRAVDSPFDGPAIQIGMAMMQLSASPPRLNDYTYKRAQHESEVDPYGLTLEPLTYLQQASEKGGSLTPHCTAEQVVMNTDLLTSQKRSVGDDGKQVHLPHVTVAWEVDGASAQRQEGCLPKSPPSPIDFQVTQNAATTHEPTDPIFSSPTDMFQHKGGRAEENRQAFIAQSEISNDKDPPPYPPQPKNAGKAALQQTNGVANKEPNYFKQTGKVVDAQGHHCPLDDVVQHQFIRYEIHPSRSPTGNQHGDQTGYEVDLRRYEVPDRPLQDCEPTEGDEQHIDWINAEDGQDNRHAATGLARSAPKSKNHDENHLQYHYPFTLKRTSWSDQGSTEGQPRLPPSGVDHTLQTGTTQHINTMPQGTHQPLGHAHKNQQMNFFHHHLSAHTEVYRGSQVNLSGNDHSGNPISYKHNRNTHGTSVNFHDDGQYTNLHARDGSARDQSSYSQTITNQPNFSQEVTPAYLYPHSAAKQLPRFLPKKLVMPTPLQPPNLPPTPPYQYPSSLQTYLHSQPIPSRSPSPVGPMPPILENTSLLLHEPPSRKLKKRPSVVVHPLKRTPSTVISFSPDLIPSTNVEKSTFRTRSERPTNRVLSKRRTNF